MSDLFSSPPSPNGPGNGSNGGSSRGNNAPPLSVSEISGAIKRELENRFDRVRVRGEISGFKRAASGHLYMSLKDDNAVLNAICWRGAANKLSIQPQDGMEVIVVGRITSYPGRSNYQIIIESMELAGEGALLKLLEERKRMLAGEGLFAEERKRALPYLPRVIGVVTSPTGAVIRDIMHRLQDRFPRHVLVWPVLVQGEGAAEQVAAAIEGFNRLPAGGEVPRPDVLIVARGGGSLEDLWAFNEEIVVRAAAASQIPLISAVGHETDTTLIDFASDRRAPTPTAAAEIAVPVRAELIGEVQDVGRRLYSGANRFFGERRMQLEALSRGLPDPRRMLEDKAQRLDDRAERLRNGMQGYLRTNAATLAELAARLPHPRQQIRLAAQQVESLGERLTAAGAQVQPRRQQEFDRLDAGRRLNASIGLRLDRFAEEIKSLDRVLESVSYKNVLKRGFAVVRDGEGGVVTADAIQSGMLLDIEFAGDRHVAAVAGEEGTPPSVPPTPKAPKAGSKPKAKRPPREDDAQGSLL